MPKTRAQYDPAEEAEKVMLELPPDQLRDKEFVWAKVKSVRGLSKMGAGRIRNRLLKSNSNSLPNGNGHSVDLMDSVGVVLKILPAVGGLEGLERAVSVIRRVKERA